MCAKHLSSKSTLPLWKPNARPVHRAGYDCINEILVNLGGATCSNMLRANVGAGPGHSFHSCSLQLALLLPTWSCARSYFEKGRLQGIEEATREIVRGLKPYYELADRTIPERVIKAAEDIIAVSARGRLIPITYNFGYLETRSARTANLLA